MSNKTETLSEFLSQANAQIRVYDLGRRVSKIKLSDFQKFEREEAAYPYPYQQTAWVGLIYWNKKESAQHNIWFLRIPLDEKGFIQLSARDEFMHLLLSRFKETLEKNEKSDNLDHVLKDNPYVFKPTDDKMAIFHSKALLILKQSPTQFYPDALKYIQGDDFDRWQHLGVQGIADIAVRLSQKNIHQLLLTAFDKMPDSVFCIFCQNIENENVDVELAKVIVERIKNSNNEQFLANGIRAISNCQSSQFKHDTLHAILEQLSSQHSVVLVVIATKAWEVLHDDKILNLFLEKLAASDAGADLFNALMVDLMFMPNLRDKILAQFRHPERSENLSKAVGVFFQTVNA